MISCRLSHCSVPMNRTEPNFRPCSSSVHQSWVQVRFSSSKLSSGSVRFTKAKVQFKFSSSLRFSVRVQSKFGSKFMNKTVTWLNPNLFMNFEPNPWISSGSVQVQILYVQFRFGSSSDIMCSGSVQVQKTVIWTVQVRFKFRVQLNLNRTELNLGTLRQWLVFGILL